MEQQANTAQGNTRLDRFRAENMAYASQSVLVNIAANVIEPKLNEKWQGRYARNNPEFFNQPQGKRYGSYWQNFGGEIAGDVGGGMTLFLASAFAAAPTQAFIDFTGRLVHPIFQTLGHIAFKEQFNEPDYQAKVDKWSRFQERNFARALIVGAGGITANVAAQKFAFKNPSPAKVIFQGKLMTTGLTNSVMLGARIYAPQKMKDLDRRMGKKYFESDNGNGHGAQPAEPQPQQPNFVAMVPPQRPMSYTDRIGQFNSYEMTPSQWERQ
ncbi:MAG: hypothetical protein AB7L92_06720 [Alphaproteobacteria bacterium]